MQILLNVAEVKMEPSKNGNVHFNCWWINNTKKSNSHTVQIQFIYIDAQVIVKVISILISEEISALQK